jgi:hypothetical protein
MKKYHKKAKYNIILILFSHKIDIFEAPNANFYSVTHFSLRFITFYILYIYMVLSVLFSHGIKIVPKVRVKFLPKNILFFTPGKKIQLF